MPYHVFETDLGWFGVRGSGGVAEAVTIGHATPQSAAVVRAGEEERDWHPALADALARFAAGEPVDLAGFPVSDPPTRFARRVAAELRRVPRGETVSYAELADRAGSPRAARAVGGVMAGNRVPLLVPCHRVVGAGGRLGGFSAPTGVELKKRLLALEAPPGAALPFDRVPPFASPRAVRRL